MNDKSLPLREAWKSFREERFQVGRYREYPSPRVKSPFPYPGCIPGVTSMGLSYLQTRVVRSLQPQNRRRNQIICWTQGFESFLVLCSLQSSWLVLLDAWFPGLVHQTSPGIALPLGDQLDVESRTTKAKRKENTFSMTTHFLGDLGAS